LGINDILLTLGVPGHFACEKAFIICFKSMTGSTPRQWLKSATDDRPQK
jgi:hypothetical protein